MQRESDKAQTLASQNTGGLGMVPMENVTSGYYPIKLIRIEEKPLLDFPEAVQLACLAVSIFIFGALVQVQVFRRHFKSYLLSIRIF